MHTKTQYNRYHISMTHGSVSHFFKMCHGYKSLIMLNCRDEIKFNIQYSINDFLFHCSLPNRGGWLHPEIFLIKIELTGPYCFYKSNVCYHLHWHCNCFQPFKFLALLHICDKLLLISNLDQNDCKAMYQTMVTLVVVMHAWRTSWTITVASWIGLCCVW